MALDQQAVCVLAGLDALGLLKPGSDSAIAFVNQFRREGRQRVLQRYLSRLSVVVEVVRESRALGESFSPAELQATSRPEDLERALHQRLRGLRSKRAALEANAKRAMASTLLKDCLEPKLRELERRLDRLGDAGAGFRDSVNQLRSGTSKPSELPALLLRVGRAEKDAGIWGSSYVQRALDHRLDNLLVELRAVCSEAWAGGGALEPLIAARRTGHFGPGEDAFRKVVELHEQALHLIRSARRTQADQVVNGVTTLLRQGLTDESKLHDFQQRWSDFVQASKKKPPKNSLGGNGDGRIRRLEEAQAALEDLAARIRTRPLREQRPYWERLADIAKGAYAAGTLPAEARALSLALTGQRWQPFPGEEGEPRRTLPER
ncbi:MAG: hypothetical protein ACKVPX_11700 [Myxococcaceae bacterium]